MKSVTRRSFLAGLSLAAGEACSSSLWAHRPTNTPSASSLPEHEVWFTSPANSWSEALPIGNGRLGAMVQAERKTHRILLNEESFWSGEPRNFHPQDGALYMDMLHDLLIVENGERADEVVMERLVSKIGESYQPLALVTIEETTPGPASDAKVNIHRSLDLRDATSATEVKYDDKCALTVKAFVSRVDDVLVVLLLNEGRAGQWSIKLESAQRSSTRNADGVLLLEARAPVHVIPERVENANAAVTWEDGPKARGMTATVALCVLEHNAGRHNFNDSGLHIEGAQEVTLLVAARTSYAGPTRSPSRDGLDDTALALHDLLTARRRHTGELLLARHTAEHRALFDRVRLSLEDDAPLTKSAGVARARSLPTDERLHRFATGEPDAGLSALYFQFGRYLLLAGSRSGTLPLTTEGIWSHRMRPNHNADWALDGGLAASYRLAETAGLPECHEPVFSLLKRLQADGTGTAERVYGVDGWTAHRNADIWCSTLPEAEDTPGAIWKCGAASLCLQVWEAFCFSGDLSFLRNFYPALQQASVFFLRQMRIGRNGWLAAFPESSNLGPYAMPGGAVAYSSFSPISNAAIIRELLCATASAAKMLGVDAALREWLLDSAALLQPLQTSRHTGELLEWPDDTWISAADENAELPQIWPLMPGAQITRDNTPTLAEAACITLSRHAPWTIWPGDEVAGTCANAYARLGDGKGAQLVLKAHLERGVQPNLLARRGFEKDEKSFTIAGNLSFASAIAEMLLQSHAGEICFLPALPSIWQAGEYTGMRARGGWEVSLRWRRARAQDASMLATRDATATIKAPPGQTILEVQGAGDFQRIDKRTIRFQGLKGTTYPVYFA